MESLIGVAGLLAVGAVSPGPNNFLVMRSAAVHGLRGALSTVGAILCGGLALIILVGWGTAAGMSSSPLVGRILTVGGCLYLIWLGGRLIFPGRRAESAAETDESTDLPLAPWAVFGFQLVNPKAWVLVLTTMSALKATLHGTDALLVLSGLFLSICLPALLLWASLGSQLEGSLRRPRTRVVFDRSMGILLVVFALLLVLGF